MHQGSALRIDLATNLIHEMSARELSQIKRFLAIFDRRSVPTGIVEVLELLGKLSA